MGLWVSRRSSNIRTTHTVALALLFSEFPNHTQCFTLVHTVRCGNSGKCSFQFLLWAAEKTSGGNGDAQLRQINFYHNLTSPTTTALWVHSNGWHTHFAKELQTQWSSLNYYFFFFFFNYLRMCQLACHIEQWTLKEWKKARQKLRGNLLWKLAWRW